MSRLAFCKVVIHMRAGHFRHNLKDASKWKIALIRFACHRTSSNLVQAENLKDQFKGLAPEERISEMPNMIDCSIYSNDDIDDFDRNTILFLGHLSHAKGYCDILKAIPKVVAHVPDVRFRFAGTKLQEERNVLHLQSTGERIKFECPDRLYDKLIRGSFDSNYEYLGVISGENKLEALRSCSIFCLPSYSEGFSMAILEAMAMGKPIICTPVGGLVDVVVDGEEGLVVDPAQPDQLADAILELLINHENRDRIASNNYQNVRKRYSKEDIGTRLANHFDSLFD